MSELIRYRYNTMAADTPGGERCWRVILEKGRDYEEVLVKRLIVNVPSFSKEDEMPVVGREYHMACYGRLRVEDGVASSIRKISCGFEARRPGHTEAWATPDVTVSASPAAS